MSQDLLDFIKRKRDELVGLARDGGLSDSDYNAVMKDIDRLYKDEYKLMEKMGLDFNKGGLTPAKADIKAKIVSIEKKIKAKIKAKGNKTVKAAKGTVVLKNYMNPVKIVNNLKGKK